jgi:diguanylate cyclase (GGDEF)-like protein
LGLFLLVNPRHSSKSFFSPEKMIGMGIIFAGGLPGLLSSGMLAIRRPPRAPQSSGPFLIENDSDRLPGIVNRQSLFDRAKAAQSWTHRNEGHLGVLLVTLNQFKAVNVNLDRGATDQLMQAFVRRIKAALRSEDTMAQLEADEFVILQVGSAQPAGAKSLADRLMKKLSEPYKVGNQRVTCGANIGIAVAPTDAWEWDTLLDFAETALYQSKTEGSGSICFFEAEMDAAFRKRLKLEADMRRALERAAFQLAFQPVFSIDHGKLVGFEALLRWPAGWEPQSPATFIPVAEECGLIVPIGAWVLETACHWAAEWTKPLKLAINLSPVQFRQGDLVSVVQQALMQSGLDPKRLELEVTEGLWMQDTEAVLDQLTRLRAMGISIALDDFGTGFSSLSCLWRFPFDSVKIDRSFVTQMSVDPKAGAIVDTIVALGKTLNLIVTAEGVETRAQASALIAAGCDRAQGYLYGRPLSATAPIL